MMSLPKVYGAVLEYGTGIILYLNIEKGTGIL